MACVCVWWGGGGVGGGGRRGGKGESEGVVSIMLFHMSSSYTMKILNRRCDYCSFLYRNMIL